MTPRQTSIGPELPKTCPGRPDQRVAASRLTSGKRQVSDRNRIFERQRVSLLVNGLGATPLEGLLILVRGTHQLLHHAGHEIYRSYVGQYATPLEMAGTSVSVLAGRRADCAAGRAADPPLTMFA